MDSQITPPQIAVNPGVLGEPSGEVRGSVVRITFRNEDTGYTVAKARLEGTVPADARAPDGLVTLVGSLVGVEPGQPLKAGGEWVRDQKFGRQFKVAWYAPTLPAGTLGIRAYLESGAVKGIGPVTAERIVDAFGDKTFDVLDKEPDRLKKVKGISGKTFSKIIDGWRTAQGDRELVVFLGDHGVAPWVAGRLRKSYGARALSVVRANPYQLTADVRGIGFRRADEIAQKIGLAPDAIERIDAALAHVLEQQSDEGHTCLPRPTLEAMAEELLGVEGLNGSDRIDAMLADKRLVAESFEGQVRLFMPHLHEAERKIAYRVRRLADGGRKLPKIDAVATLADFEQRSHFRLADAQRKAALQFAGQGLMILTGGPGTGKTTTVRAILELFQAGRSVVRLAAPTGRAARRLAETAKLPADTIHRLLGFQPHTSTFLRDATNPIEADLIVVDETSMLDAPLAAALLEAVAPQTCLLMIGDEDQLPSVGPGNVLGDLISAEALPLARLTEVFRQAGQSLIVANAHRINRGMLPVDAHPSGASETGEPDYFFVERDDPDAAREAIVALAAERIPKKFGLDPLADIQVLTPMRRGPLGVHALNAALKARLNPDPGAKPGWFGEESAPGDEPPRRIAPTVGDRVMQTANNYDKGVSNGDIGRVESVVMEDGQREIVVRFEGRSVSYLADELDQLALAYAATVHKAQGSEYPAVIIPVHTQHWIMLQRNLIYTALTRARRLVCLVGSKRALRRAVANGQRAARWTGLKRFLLEAHPAKP